MAAIWKADAPRVTVGHKRLQARPWFATAIYPKARMVH